MTDLRALAERLRADADAVEKVSPDDSLSLAALSSPEKPT